MVASGGNETTIISTNIIVSVTYSPPNGAPTTTTTISGSNAASVTFSGHFQSASASYSIRYINSGHNSTPQLWSTSERL
jgi:hypothetical protein